MWLVRAFSQCGVPAYDGLVDLGLEKHFRVNHGNNEFVKGSRHVNGIDSFGAMPSIGWLSSMTYKETEFHFNHRHFDLYKTLLKLLRNDPL